MKLALDASTKLLPLIHAFADFDFISTERILKDKDYAQFYQDSSNVKFVSDILLPDKPLVPMDDLKRAVEFVKGTYVLNNYQESVKVFGPEKTVGVLGGQTPAGILQNLAAYSSRIIAVPITPFLDENLSLEYSAYARALVVTNIPKDRAIHLIDYISLNELTWYVGKPNIVSLSTCVPVILGLRGEDILEPTSDITQLDCESENYEKLKQDRWSAVCRNIALLRKTIA